MIDRKHCTECELEYSDEASHQLVHTATLAATPPDHDPDSRPSAAAAGLAGRPVTKDVRGTAVATAPRA
jgi:hypothetical protein